MGCVLCFYVIFSFAKLQQLMSLQCVGSRNGEAILLTNTGELGYDRPLYDRFLHMTYDMLGPSPMHIKYSSYVYDGFCI